jgi:hypothetical protein
MAAIDPDAEPEAEFAICYRNLGSALVTVTRKPKGTELCTAACAGCLDTYDEYNGTPYLDRVRTWANKHAGECRALPQPEQRP